MSDPLELESGGIPLLDAAMEAEADEIERLKRLWTTYPLPLVMKRGTDGKPHGFSGVRIT